VTPKSVSSQVQGQGQGLDLQGQGHKDLPRGQDLENYTTVYTVQRNVIFVMLKTLKSHT